METVWTGIDYPEFGKERVFLNRERRNKEEFKY